MRPEDVKVGNCYVCNRYTSDNFDREVLARLDIETPIEEARWQNLIDNMGMTVYLNDGDKLVCKECYKQYNLGNIKIFYKENIKGSLALNRFSTDE